MLACNCNKEFWSVGSQSEAGLRSTIPCAHMGLMTLSINQVAISLGHSALSEQVHNSNSALDAPEVQGNGKWRVRAGKLFESWVAIRLMCGTWCYCCTLKFGNAAAVYFASSLTSETAVLLQNPASPQHLHTQRKYSQKDNE